MKLRHYQRYFTVLTDPVPYNLIVEGNTYVVDEWGVKYETESLISEINEVYNQYCMQFTGRNLGTIEVGSITT